MTGPGRRHAIGAVKIAAAVFLTWLALHRIDFAHATQIVARLPAGIAMGAIALLVLQALLSAWRWALVSGMAGAPLPLWPAVRIFLISLFYNQTLPSSFPGDGARVWGAAKFGGVSNALAGVFFDRLLTLLALALLAALSLVALVERADGQNAVLLPLLIIALIIGVPLTAFALRQRLVSWLPARGAAFALRLEAAARRLVVFPAGLGLLALSLLIHGLGIATVYVLARGMGVPLGAGQAVIAVPLVLLAALFPISINGWGVREGAMVAMLAGFGIARTEAATLSVMFGLFQLALGLAGGVLLLLPGAYRKAAIE